MISGLQRPGRSTEISHRTDGDRTVQKLVASDYAFAAVLSDQSVITWGHHSFGGNSRNSVAHKGNFWPVITTRIHQVYITRYIPLLIISTQSPLIMSYSCGDFDILPQGSQLLFSFEWKLF